MALAGMIVPRSGRAGGGGVAEAGGEAMIVGGPWYAATVLGALVGAAQRGGGVDYIQKGGAEGARRVSGGGAAAEGGEGGFFFVRPIFSDACGEIGSGGGFLACVVVPGPYDGEEADSPVGSEIFWLVTGGIRGGEEDRIRGGPRSYGGGANKRRGGLQP